MVSDLSLADLCRELNQQSSASSTFSPSSSTDEEEREIGGNDVVERTITKTTTRTTTIVPTTNDAINNDEDRFPSPILEQLDDENERVKEEINNHGSNEEKEDVRDNGDDGDDDDENEGKHLSLADFKRQSDELLSYLDNFKQMKLERERQDEESQVQLFQDEKIAALHELDNMVNFINNVKTTFTPPEKEKPQRREAKKSNSYDAVASPFIGKGKYASKGKSIKGHSSLDDPDATITTVSNSRLSSPREQQHQHQYQQDQDEEGVEDGDEEDNFLAHNNNNNNNKDDNQEYPYVSNGKRSPLYHHNGHHDDEGEHTSQSDESEYDTHLLKREQQQQQLQQQIDDLSLNSNPNSKNPSQNSGFWGGLFSCASE